MQTANGICLLHILVGAATHVEGREHTFNPSTPSLPHSYIKSTGEFLQEKGAVATTLRNILFLCIIFEAAETSYWKDSERYVTGEERRNGTYLTETPMACLA